MLKALHCGFGNNAKVRVCRLADPVPLTLDLSNLKLMGFDTVSMTTNIMCQVSSHSGQVILVFILSFS